MSTPNVEAVLVDTDVYSYLMNGLDTLRFIVLTLRVSSLQSHLSQSASYISERTGKIGERSGLQI